MHFHIITLFPGAFDSYLGESILKRAIIDKKLKVSFYNPRDFTQEKNARIDKPPYGGGPGMVIQAEPVIKAIAKAKGKKKRVKIILFSPGGNQFTNEYAQKVAKGFSDIILVCGRYEGIDARIKKAFPMDEISIGPFVLTGGELPAMIVIDGIARRRKGILGNFDSVEERRVSSHDSYTRPEVIVYKGKKFAVPKVLLSGDHKKIDEWREGRGDGKK